MVGAQHGRDRSKDLLLLEEAASPQLAEGQLLDDLNNCVSVSLPADRICYISHCQMKGKQSHKQRMTCKPIVNLLKLLLML